MLSFAATRLGPMSVLHDELQKFIANKTIANNTMMLAVYLGSFRNTYCAFYVTRNMLDPPWFVQVVAQHIEQDGHEYYGTGHWCSPMLARTKASLEAMVDTIMRGAMPPFDDAVEVWCHWIYTQGRTAPPNPTSASPMNQDTCVEHSSLEPYDGDYDVCKEVQQNIIKNILEKIEALVATA